MRRFIVHIAILQPLETGAVRFVALSANTVETALLIASLEPGEGEYISEISINLFGRLYRVWDYLNGKRVTRLKI